MTMHLAQGLTTTKTSRDKKKPITPKELQNYTAAWRAHNKDCRRRYLHSMQFKTVEEYITYVQGSKYVASTVKSNINVTSKTKSNTFVAENKGKTFVSRDIPTGALSKPEPKVYSGERRLVGIAIMHKSNLVPIFEDEEGGGKQEATEIANMSK